ncbi:DUF6460 domain-containing protein [Chenggangzhangella methanolivorans]|uniref:DUF6460 domain-containing protein n=1 Tax=Chenggangzhangella methanolivorans TaxID=1437009 RepID=UPI0021BD5929|nr:DUF6460 domain-containing protein [Chenggangzhangella methanolivorans]
MFRRDGEAGTRYGSGTMTRIFGGSPLGVLIRLALLCVIVGLILDQLDLNAFELFRWVADEIENLIRNSADVLRLIGRYFLIGAAVVIPIWIVMRVLNVGGRR